MELFWIFLFFNLFIGLCSIRMIKGLTDFESFALNLLFLVSVYAVAKTSFQSVYCVPLVSIIGLCFRRGFVLSPPSGHFLGRVLLSGNILWLAFFFMYAPMGKITFPHEDYIIYYRVGYYNDVFGVENTLSFYNLFEDQKKIHIYHFFEAWLMNLGAFFTNTVRPLNLILFSYPMIGLVSVLGLKQWFPKFSWLSCTLIFILAALTVSPYDVLVLVKKLNLPVTGIGYSLKTIVIFPIILYLLAGIRSGRLNYFILCLLTFYYPVTIPVVVGALIIYHLVTFRLDKSADLVPPVILSLAFILFGLINGTGDTISSISGFWDFNALLKIGFTSFFLPIACFGIMVYVVEEKGRCANTKNVILYFFVANIISLALWYILKDNVNANQFFRNLFGAFYMLMTGAGIALLFQQKRWFFLAASIIVYILPSFIVNNKSIFASEKDIELAFVLPASEKVLFFPDAREVRTIFHYHERFYMEVNTVFLIRENINIVNTAASFPISFPLRDNVAKNMVSFYRSISPVFKSCGELKEGNMDCIRDFMKQHDIRYVLARKDKNWFPEMKVLWSGQELKLMVTKDFEENE